MVDSASDPTRAPALVSPLPPPGAVAASGGAVAGGAGLPAGRRLPVGAEVAPGGVHFRVWAPDRERVQVVWSDREAPPPAADVDRTPGAPAGSTDKTAGWASAGDGAGRASAGDGAGRVDEDGRRAPVDLRRAGPEGYFEGFAAGAAAGDLYRLRLDGGDALPDPASRFQPEGPHGPSQVVDPAAFRWSDGEWRGAGRDGQVLYELHIGTCTGPGTWEAAERLLPALADLGITVLEVMPVAEFPGSFGWGYDGVGLFAPTRLYGVPDAFRRFVDRAHGLSLGVILDVVYNHFGPDGNYLKAFAAGYFTDRHANDWGEAIQFDGPAEVREFFIANAEHWIAEYHLDGLRLDATQDIHDSSGEHIVAAIGRAARRAAAALPPGRSVLLVAENEPQDSRLVRPAAAGGYGLDAIWVDDFHHAARVALTGRAEAYYSDYAGSPRELAAAVRYGPLFQGQRYSWQKQRRGTPATGLPHSAFVYFLENHDQVANSARGERLHMLASPGGYRALTALLLLGPATPMLFQGQESGSASPWYYFCDHQGELARAVKAGRLKLLGQFPSIAGEVARHLPAPEALETFLMSKLETDAPATRTDRLDSSDRSDGADRSNGRDRRDGSDRRRTAALALHRDLLRLRREDPVFRLQGAAGLDTAVLGPAAFVVRFFAPSPGAAAAPATAASQGAGASLADVAAGADVADVADGPGDRLLLINLGRDLALAGPSEPLLAPPPDGRWQVLWSSEAPAYGGSGAAPPEDSQGRWCIPGQAAVVMRPARRGGEVGR